MSVNKHLRAAWVRVTYQRAVRLFHAARKAKENETADLAELARRCANSAFRERAHLILRGAEEVTAREFMSYCRENFTDEIYRVVSQPEPEVEPVN